MKSTFGDYCLFGIEALRQRLPALTQEIAGVRAAEDIEYIHRMRVATRRLRAALALFEECLPRKRFAEWEAQIKRITKALGAARDTDVQIDVLQSFLASLTDRKQQAGIKRLLLRLQQQREQLQVKVIKALDDLESGRVIDDMTDTLHEMFVQARVQAAGDDTLHAAGAPAEVATEVYQRAEQAIRLKLEEFLAYEMYVPQPDRIAELHAMRIAAKHLRYTLEIFAPLYDDNLKKPIKVVKEMQEMLGDIHDCDVWIAYVPQFLEEERARALEYFGHDRSARRFTPGILALQADRQRFRDERYAQFVKFWERLQDDEAWSKLRSTLIPGPSPAEGEWSGVDIPLPSEELLDTD
jgi:CHAD domain-containing protein